MKTNEEYAIDYAENMFPYDIGGDDSNNEKHELVREVAETTAQWKDEQPIVEQGGWHTENPTEDCFVLLETNEFPKNCRYIVAEWDDDAKCFYSESSDFPVKDWDRWKFIDVNNFIL